MADNDRELRIRATADASQAKAELDSLVQANAEVAASAEAVGETTQASSDAQAAAIAEVNAALDAAMAAMGEFATTAATGGAAAEAAFTAVRDATAELEVAIEAAKAAGSPVSPNAVSTLEAYDATLAETVAAQEAASASSGKAANNFGLFRAEAALGSEAMGPLGRALSGLAQSTDATTASIGKFLLPLAAAAGAVAILGKALSDLHDRGVDVTKLGDLVGAAMDQIAIAAGGTSKAMVEAEKAASDFQKTLSDLDPAARSYANAQSLIAATGIEAAGAFAAAVDKATDLSSILKYGIPGPVEVAREILRQFNTDLNQIRITSPEVATQLVKDFKDQSQAAKAGSQEAVAAEQAIIDKAHELAGASRDQVAQIKKDFGDDGPKAFGAFSAATVVATQHMTELRAAGASEADIFKILKPEIEAAAVGADRFATVLPNLSKGFRDSAVDLLNFAKAHDPIIEAIRNLQSQIEKEAISVGNINIVMSAHSETLTDQNLAYHALKPSIDSQIAALEALQVKQGSLDVVQEMHLQQLLKIREQYDSLNPAMKKLEDAFSSQERALGNLGKRFDDLTLSYEKNRAEVEKNAASQIRQAQAGAAAVSKSVDVEIASLNQSELGNAAYFAKIAELQGKKVDAVRDAESKTATIQDDEQTKLDELQTAYGESTAEIKRILGEQGQTIESARKKHEELAKQAKDTSADLVTEANRHADLAASVGRAFGSTDTILKNLAKSDGGLSLTKKAMDELGGAADAANGKVVTLLGNLGKISISNTAGGGAGAGSSTPDNGLGGTPGSEGD